MLPRQKQLFKNIVAEYIKTASPVGSKLIVDKFHLNVSPATVRNDMCELEKRGLISQPYTSAGRVPTEYGYKYYLNNYVNIHKELSKKEKDEIAAFLKELRDQVQKIKVLAKIIAEKSNLGVFVGFKDNDVYYTGLANIFAQPEFRDLDLVFSLSSVIDHLDDAMGKIYNQVNGLEIKIGKDNFFADNCASIMVKIRNILMGIVGPMRMDYQKNIKLINFAKDIL